MVIVLGLSTVRLNILIYVMLLSMSYCCKFDLRSFNGRYKPRPNRLGRYFRLVSKVYEFVRRIREIKKYLTVLFKSGFKLIKEFKERDLSK